MIKNKQLKNNIIFVFLLVLLVVFGFVVVYSLPNELGFKIFNNQAIQAKTVVLKNKKFSKARQAHPAWSLVIESNELDELYKTKKYEDLQKKLTILKDKNCSPKAEKISVFCENVFYLDGLVQYRLGESKKEQEQKDFFAKAVKAFQYALAVNPSNVWAKENIDFILKKQTEKQKQNGNKKDDKQKKKDDKQNGENKNGKNSKQNSNEKSTSDKKSETSKKGKGTENTKSRLPETMNQALEQRQKELERAQKNQKGFARSQSKAQQNKQELQDPFSAFRNFFGNDPFFNNLSKKQLKKELSNPDEKDW